MTEEGTLSIVRRGNIYQVRYASNNPHDKDRQPHECHDQDSLEAFLHQLGTEAASINQACATLQKGGVPVLRILLSFGQIQEFFRPTTSRETRREVVKPATREDGGDDAPQYAPRGR